MCVEGLDLPVGVPAINASQEKATRPDWYCTLTFHFSSKDFNAPMSILDGKSFSQINPHAPAFRAGLRALPCHTA